MSKEMNNSQPDHRAALKREIAARVAAGQSFDDLLAMLSAPAPIETAKPAKSRKTKAERSRKTGQVIERWPDKCLLRIFLGRDSAGKRHDDDETFHRKKRQVQDRLRALLTKHKAGESLKINKDTLSTFLDEWLLASQDLKESTITHYEHIGSLYIRPYWGNLMLAKVEASDIQTLDKTLAEAGLSRGTTRFDMLFTLAFHTGCRPGETLGLKWDDLDMSAQTLKSSEQSNGPRKPLQTGRACIWTHQRQSTSGARCV